MRISDCSSDVCSSDLASRVFHSPKGEAPVPRQAYVNGRYAPHGDAAVHIEDRGYQFADGVYEVVPVFDGILVDEDLHFDRLDRSLGELRIAQPMSRPALTLVARALMRRNGLTNGMLYMTVTRGVAPRDHKFPKASTRPPLVMTTRQTRSEEHTSELQSLMRNSYAVFCLKKNK